MFNKFRKNISEGFDVVKDAVSDTTDNLQEAFNYSKDIVENEEPSTEYTPRVDNALYKQDQRDFTESSNSLFDWFDNYQQKEADEGRFSLLNIGKIGEHRAKEKERKEGEEKLFEEGVFDKSDMSLFGKGLKSVEERTAGGVYDMLLAPVFRSGVALTNFLSGKTGQAMNYVNDKTGFGFQVEDDTNSWMKNSVQFLEETNPRAGDNFKTFFGLTDEQDDVNLNTVGEEWAELVNIIPGLDIKPDSKMIPALGFIGSAIDVIPGSSGGKNALKTAVKNAKNVDEVLLVLKGLAKGSDDDMLRFANDLFKAKESGSVPLMKMIELEDAGESTVNFFKNGKKIETNIEKVTTEQVRKVLDDVDNVVDVPATTGKSLDNLVNTADELEAIGFQSSKLDEVGEVLAEADVAEKELRGLIDEIKKVDLPEEASAKAKELKKIFNQGAYDDLPLSQRLKALDLVDEVTPLITDTKGGMVDLLNYYKKIDQGLVDNLRTLDKSVLDDFAKQFTEGLANAQNRVAKGIAEDNFDEAINGIVTATEHKNIAGKVLNVVGEVKAKVKTTKAQDRLGQAVKSLKTQGKSTEDIVSMFKKGADEKGKALSELDVKDIEDIFAKNSPTNWGSLLEMYRYSNMLSNTATHAINMMSNTVENTVARPVVEEIASFIELVLPKSMRTGREVGEIGTYYKSLFKPDTFNKSIKKAINVFNEVDELKHTDIDRLPAEWKVGGRDIAKDFRIPLRALEAGDAVMYTAVFEGELAKVLKRKEFANAGRLTTTQLNKARKIADETAQDAIFRMQKNTKSYGMLSHLTSSLADGVKVLDKSMNDVILKGTKNKLDIHPVKWMVPFVNTIARLSTKHLRRIPGVGMLEALGSKDVAGVMADQVFGAGLTYAGFQLYSHNKEKFKLDRGNKNATSTKYADNEGNAYESVQIGENWHQLEALGPSSGPIFFGANIAKAVEDGKFDIKDKELVNTAMEFIGVILTLQGGELTKSLDQKFMGSALDLPAVIRGDKNPATQMAQTARQFIPYSSAMGAINRAFVDNEKKITPQTFMEALEYLQKDIPGLSKNLTQKTDRDGVPLFYGKENKTALEGVNELLNPGRPQFRNEDIHNKYLQEKEREDLRDANRVESTKTRDQDDINMVQNIMTGQVPDGMKDVYKERMKELGEKGIKDLVNDFENQGESQGSRHIDAILKGRGTDEAKRFLKESTPDEIESYVKEFETRETSRLKLIVEKVMSGSGDDSDKESLKKADPKLLDKAVKSYERSLK